MGVQLNQTVRCSTIQVGIAVKLLCAAKNSAFKNHPRDILRNQNHLYGIVLAHIINKTASNARNTYR